MNHSKMNHPRYPDTRILGGCLLVLFLLSATDGFADSHFHNVNAEDCYVDKFNYKNNGDYTVKQIDLVFVTSRSEKSEISGNANPDKLGYNIYSGGSANIDLNSLENMSGSVSGSKLKDGMEVWPRIKILGGESNSCHKDGHRLVYKKGINRAIHFKSGGTTQNNNRCEYAESIEQQCSTAPKQEPR